MDMDVGFDMETDMGMDMYTNINMNMNIFERYKFNNIGLLRYLISPYQNTVDLKVDIVSNLIWKKESFSPTKLFPISDLNTQYWMSNIADIFPRSLSTYALVPWLSPNLLGRS